MTDQATPDFTRLPSGEREWPDFIQQAAAAGDIAERHFIELKSEIDPTGKEGAAKVAKFILGAAHRDPDRAAKYLGGYAVMILGVAHNDVRGIARFEAKDLVGAVQQYVGEPGPRWDFVRIRVDDDHDVIVIVVDPPQPGAIWPCCREGVGLADGRIYIRGDGETRDANHDEVRTLVERTRTVKTGPQPELAIALSGFVHRYTCDASVLDEYLAGERERLEAILPSPPAATAETVGRSLSLGAASYLAGPSFGGMLDMTTEPEPRSREEYLSEIDEWEKSYRAAWPDFVSQAAAFICDATAARIEACSKIYLPDVKIKLQLDGPVHAAESPTETSDFESLPSPPRPWGPQNIMPYLPEAFGMSGYGLPNTTTHIAPPIYLPYDNVDIDNSKSARLEVLVTELRPNDPYISSDAVFLSVPYDHDEPITGKWTATAKDHHDMHSGEIRLELAEPLDLTETLRHYLSHSPEDDEDDTDG
jgi:hypothetical protein